MIIYFRGCAKAEECTDASGVPYNGQLSVSCHLQKYKANLSQRKLNQVNGQNPAGMTLRTYCCGSGNFQNDDEVAGTTHFIQTFFSSQNAK